MLELPQVQRNLISSMQNFVYELPHMLSNDLRLRVFKNWELLGEPLILAVTHLSA